MTVSGHNEISPGIVLFDGLCHLCSGWVRFVFHRDKQARIRFAPLQSNIAKEFMEKLDVSANSLETIVYIESDKAYIKSTAVLKVLKRLRFPWPILAIGLIIPRPLRDWMYDVIARRRYRWFGQREVCMMPNEELKTDAHQVDTQQRQ